MTDGPRRLLEGDSGAPPELQRLLASARRDVPSQEQLQQLATRLAPVVGGAVLAGASSSAATPAAGVLKSGSVLKLMLAGAVATGLGVGVALTLGGNEPAPELGHPARAARALLDVEPSPGAHEAAPAPAEPVAEPEPTAADPEPAAEPEHEPSAPRRPASGPSEAQLLQQAQAMLKTDPARALALTRVHKQRFPKGTLAQEREVIAIEAMRRLGRSSDAERRADEFRRRNPDSAHLPRIERSTPRP